MINPPVRVATPADVDAIVAAMTTAFFDDPLWGPAFPDVERRAEQAGAMWRLFATSALRYPWMLVTEHVESAAIWLPPGGVELTPEEAAGFEDRLVEIAGRSTAAGIVEILERLEEHYPSEPHFFLSLLATHRDHRGRGLGMGLLRESLARIDAIGAPAYLESCNPANDARYASVGFVPHGTVTVPSGHVVRTMWRPARS
ncbi:GNAT superfamily N-acetyltransferase [Kitasatospora sp. MAA4]|uniref:GNAT family N-acetyltransferase n=1 Tax=Kitasatospora sp. MAA4 TaxID=3035093 RepID=UPI00247560DA|nr:GNAT family N-acetyltransferase [Kitasatospora sp. MAA4]MDH6137879.1 GNAT superfamily N-acetyltransferase [Kitasatospora sp. MAA4]